MRVRFAGEECDAVDLGDGDLIVLDHYGYGWNILASDRVRYPGIPESAKRGWFVNLHDAVIVTAPSLRDACSKLGDVLEEKAKAYGDSYKQGGEFLRGLYPNGVPIEAYDDMLTLVRCYDKMKRVANNPGQADPGGEDPFGDLAGYAILAQVRRAG